MRATSLLASLIILAGSLFAAQPGEEEAAPVHQYIIASFKAGHVKTAMLDPSGKTYPVQLAAADNDGVTIVRDGGRMLLSWKQFKPKEVYYLAKGLLQDTEVEPHLQVARLALKIGLGADMLKPLEQLQGNAPGDSARIEPLRAEIAAQVAAAQPKPPPATKVQPPQKKEPAEEVPFYDEEFLGPFPSWANLKTDFHAAGDGKADDTKALQAAFDELATARQVHKVLFLPEGTYRITATLEMTDTREFYVVGEHPDKVIIKWDGPKGGAMFHSNAMRDCRWERMTWDGAGKAGMLLNLAWEGKLGNGSTNMQWVDVYFKDAEIGINAGVGGFMVSETAVRRCRFTNLSKAGITLNTGNVLNWWLRHCVFEDCNQGVAGNLGGYYARECFFKNSRDADFVITASCTFAIRDNVSIGSNAFLAARDNATHWAHVTMQNNEVLAAGGPAIQVVLQAPFLMIDNRIALQKGAAGKGMTANAVLLGNQYMNCQPCAFTGKVLRVDERQAALQIRPPVLPGPLPLQRRPIFEVHPGANSAQLQKAILEACALSGKRPVVHLPQGGYSIDATVVIPPNADVQIVGDGFRTRVSAGKGTGPMFEIRGPSRASLRHFTLYGPGRKGVDVPLPFAVNALSGEFFEL
ncbi:MAG: glycosyl hydrolase family 28-related protein [Planctomycetota bacterium]|nr:glycosyl hydrolase family 28-related protein [Planctomycetota bacterium]